MWRLKHQKVLVLILEHKLINKRVLLQTFKCFGKFLHIEMTTSVLQYFQMRVSYRFVIAENVVTEGEVWV